MKKIIILFFIFANIAYGYTYNEVLLKAQASIFPKIMLLDKKLNDKLIEGKIIYTVVYEKDDYNAASEVRKFIKDSHQARLDKYQYTVNLVEFSDFSHATKSSAIYVLNSNENIQKVAEIAKEKGIIAFAYDIENLKNGLLFSLMIEKSTILYVNKENLYSKKIDFVDSLLQMVRFIDKEHS
ncbi:hypothetical protein KKG72_04425 [bacterium]|nr:hypothetical protein [bacterium]MBU1994316.1 hypothetical protein [bacterium]